MKRAVLVRVGIDLTSGGWIAPVNPSSGEFAYVPIPENEGKAVVPGYERTYDEFKKPCEKLGCPIPFNVTKKFTSVHLDPDFSSLTYGDIDEIGGKRHRGKPLLQLQEDDLLVFYAGLDHSRKKLRLELVYAIIGLYVIKDRPRRATDIPDIEKFRDKNAHTRRDYKKADIIVSAKPPPLSGRLEKCIPIGERKSNGHYYLNQSLFDEWGGFSHRSRLWLQRSPVLPSFDNAEKFYDWFLKELDKYDNHLVQKNNLD